MGTRFNKAIVPMLATSREPLTTDPQLAAYMLQDAMVGVSRRMLESGAPEKQLDTLRRELIFMTCAYLDAFSAHVSVQRAGAIGDADEELPSEIPDVVRKDMVTRLKRAAPQ
jgi:hypothetical protein